jgi:hypothetical protein
MPLTRRNLLRTAAAAAVLTVPGIGRVTLQDLKVEAARRTPATFGYIVTDGKFTLARHVNYISDRIAAGIERGGYRGIVCAPPRHAKSTEISQMTPAWFLSRHPDKRVILMAYGDDFAATWGRKVRDTLVEAHANGYTRTQIERAGDAATDEWNTTAGGGMKTAGIMGGVLGRGANLLLLDDPVKNSAEAYSPTYQERMRDIYQSTASTRLEPGASVIVTMQRWPAYDFVSWLIDQGKEGREQWDLISLPAVAGADDPLGRVPGEALWPERYTVTDLDRIRLSLEDPAFWLSQWQQSPPEASMEGLAYHAFSADHSITDCQYNPKLPLCLACDFNVDPMCWLIAQVQSDFSPQYFDVFSLKQQDEVSRKTIRILDEIYLPNSTTQAATDTFIERVEAMVRSGQRVEVIVYGDASGHSRKTSGLTDYRVIEDRLRQSGRFIFSMRASRSDPPVRDRVTTVNNALLNAAGERRLLIDPKCKELRKDFGQMRWKRDVAGNPTGELDKSNPQRSHISDALGYLCWGELKMQGKGGWM